VIAFEAHGDVALLRMRAGKANAMNTAFFEALSHALDETCDARALVITGDGTAFSAGLALPELIELDRSGMGEFTDRFERTMAKVLACKCATVAAINGHAVAGGCVLALMCDERIVVAEGARIGLNEIRLGIGLPSIVVEPLRLRVAGPAFAAIALEGELVDGRRAVELGLAGECRDRDGVVARAIVRAAALGQAPVAYAQIKRAILRPVLAAVDAYTVDDREAWLDSWFSPHARRQLVAAAERIRPRR
jgi:enoyl-CoA hydratase